MTYIAISIIINHTMSMKRITVTLPGYLHENLSRKVPPGQVSRFIAEAVENRLLNAETEDAIEEFVALRAKLKKYRKSGDSILKAIKKGRL